jgi:hypothetical protein
MTDPSTTYLTKPGARQSSHHSRGASNPNRAAGPHEADKPTPRRYDHSRNAHPHR